MKMPRSVNLLLILAVLGVFGLTACNTFTKNGNKQPPDRGQGKQTTDSPPTAKQPGRTGLIGCFKDPNNPYDLDGHLERSAGNTPQRCVEICKGKGFPYAGVQYGQSCLCGNSYGKFGTADNCNMKCTGDSSQICGGYNSNNVYGTGVSVEGDR
jgi:hypothetical protein